MKKRKPAIEKRKGILVFVDRNGREWIAENLQDLVDAAEHLYEAGYIAKYYHREA